MRYFLLAALLATVSSTAFAQEETTIVKEKSNKSKASIPYKCTDQHYADSSEDETAHRARHFDDCKEFWVNMPTDIPSLTPMPTKFPTKSPSLGTWRDVMMTMVIIMIIYVLTMSDCIQSQVRPNFQQRNQLFSQLINHLIVSKSFHMFGQLVCRHYT